MCETGTGQQAAQLLDSYTMMMMMIQLSWYCGELLARTGQSPLLITLNLN
jgi:hypothetical protein